MKTEKLFIKISKLYKKHIIPSHYNRLSLEEEEQEMVYITLRTRVHSSGFAVNIVVHDDHNKDKYDFYETEIGYGRTLKRAAEDLLGKLMANFTRGYYS